MTISWLRHLTYQLKISWNSLNRINQMIFFYSVRLSWQEEVWILPEILYNYSSPWWLELRVQCFFFWLFFNLKNNQKIYLVRGQKWNSTVTFGDKNINWQLFLLKGALCLYVTLSVPCSVSAQNQMDEGAKNRRQWRGLYSGLFKENVSTPIQTDWLSWLGIKKNHF